MTIPHDVVVTSHWTMSLTCDSFDVDMTPPYQTPGSQSWSVEALAMAAQAKGMSGRML
jgi:hypothetical protein